MKFTPRNTLILLRLKLKAEERVGELIVPAGNEEYAEAEVLAVGPGNIMSAGGQSETFDLKPGQRVLVKHKKKMQRPAQVGGVQTTYMPEGIPLKPKDGEDLWLFEQGNILAIVG